MKEGNADRGAQAVYFSHGGGPLPILGDPGHQAMVEFMTRLPAQLRRPGAIVVSAHWEERAVTLLGAPNPPMYYDYYGFPKEAHSITYPAPGHPALAEPIAGLVASNDSPTALGYSTTLTASVAAGSHVTYTWALGDGTVRHGTILHHSYPAIGLYTAVVTASNSVNTLTATTVTVTAPSFYLYLPLIRRSSISR